ncbi:hypothetical protein [Bacillus sp. FJAT-45350]|uniref:hypothetical protein n=1 Tax=Bacillus sp. FJAT-45350 TaxID=2011014 RepID=UPI000BB68598|nr:hypothetical protein [Bacillus sp. FJAT-45350]
MNRSKILLQTSAIYAVIGVFLGGHMAGAGSYLFRAIHAHILVVGWLSLFAFAIFYSLYYIPKSSILAKVHVWTSFIGTLGFIAGMWAYYFKPEFLSEVAQLVFFIAGGTILMIGFFAFAILVFVHGRAITDKEEA